MGKWVGRLVFVVAGILVLAVQSGHVSHELFLFLVGIGFTALGLMLLVRNKAIIRNGEYADATVVETKRERMRGRALGQGGGAGVTFGGGRAYTYVPILRYNVNGRTHRVRWHGHAKQKYKDGEVLRIKYSKKDVEKIAIVGDNIAYIGSAIFGLAGIIMLGISLHMYFS